MAFFLQYSGSPNFCVWKGHKCTFKKGEKTSKRPKEVEDDVQLEEVGEVMEGCQRFLSYFQSSSNLHLSTPTEDNGNILNSYTQEPE